MTSPVDHAPTPPAQSSATGPLAGPPLRVLIVGADALFVDALTPKLEGLGMVIFQPGSTRGGSGRRHHEPDVVLVDADGDHGETVRTLSHAMPNAKRVLMSATLDQSGVRTAVQQGFRGAVSKDIPLHRFESAIRSVIKGDLVIEVRAPQRGQRDGKDPDNARAVVASLTSRELEILTLLVDGASGPEMARRLSLSPHTVRTHVQNVMTKLQVHSRVEAAAYAVRHLIVRPGSGHRPGEQP
jgi:two-component system, NarL family, nitrate/nitrite response regulator NarL